jgi:hypothetical protein
MAAFVPIVISTGLQLLSSLFKKPTKSQQIDFRSPNVNLGGEIPTFFGKVRIETTMIFPKTTDKMYRVKTRRSKGKGMASVTTKTVYGTWISLVSANHCSLHTVIINGTHISTSDGFYQKYCTFFDGTQTSAWSEAQIKYPGNYEADIAYTGLSLLCFKDVPLEDYGNVIPTEIAVIVLDDRLGTDPSVGYVVQTICEEAGIPNSAIDVTEIIPIQLKTGLNVVQSGEGFRTAIEQLMQFYQFGAIWSNGKVKFKLFDRGNDGPTDIPLNDFFPIGDDGGNTSQDGSSDRHFIRKKQDKQSLPNKLTIKYFNQNKKHHQDSYTVSFPEYTKENIVNIDTTISTYPYEVEERAMDLLKMNYLQSRLHYTFKVSSQYFNLEALDLVLLPNGEIVQILSKTFGNDFLIEIEAFYYAGQKNYSLIPPFEQSPDTSPSLPNPTTLPDIYILDVPQFENNPPATLYILASLPATLNLSFDVGDSYPSQINHLDISTIGNCTNALPNGIGLDIVNTLDVTLTSGELEQITQNQFDDGQNLALLGKLNVNGFYEGKLIRFRDVLLVAPNQYELTYIYQGDYNTSNFDSSSLPLKFFLLRSPNTSYYSTLLRNTEDLSKPLQILPVISDWQDINTTPITTVSGFNNNAYVSPPVENITAEIDPANNILLKWDDTYLNESPYQNGTEQINYQIEIYSDAGYSVLKRTDSSTQFKYFYSVTDRTADGVTIPFYVKITRINSITGLGQSASATINPNVSIISLGVIDADLLQGENGGFYLDRSNHTNTQLANTISDFDESVDDRVADLLVAGNGISLTYDDVANTLTIDSAFTGFTTTSVTTNYTVVLGIDIIYASNSITITLPDGFPLWYEVLVRNIGTGTITMVATTTLQAPGTKIDAQYRCAHFLHVGSNIWHGTGWLNV